jgi:CspA family cold shock protein
MATGMVKWSMRPRDLDLFSPIATAKMYSCHFPAVERAGLSTLNEGTKVSYEEKENRGKTSAEILRVVG